MSSRWMAGIGAAYTKAAISMNTSVESANSVAPRAFGYLGYTASGSVARFGASVARNSYQIRRAIRFTARLPEVFGDTPLFGGVNRVATSAPAATSADAWADWSRPVQRGAWGLSPSVGLRYARSSQRAWSESGADSLSLSSVGQTTQTAQADLGIRIARALGQLVPSASVAYRRDLTASQSSNRVQISGDADGTFLIDGPSLLPQMFTMRAGTTLVLARVGLSLNYESQFGHGRPRQLFRIGADF